jgi:hypothetical protein
VLTAIGLGIVIVGVLIVSNVWKTPTYNVILAWDRGVRPLPGGPDLPLGDHAARRAYSGAYQHDA